MQTTQGVLTAATGPPNSAGDQQFPALTGIRFPLAIWVIVHHLTGPGAMLDATVRSTPTAAQDFIRLAYAALGTFFVLSGFVLQRSYRATLWDGDALKRYGVARLARFYPVYLLSLLVLAPIIHRHITSAPELGSTSDRAWLLFNYCFVLQGWAKLPVDWNTPAWSLSCELFFYLFFPIVVVLMRRGSWPRILLTGALAFTLPVIVRALGAPPAWKPILFFGDFLAGVALAGVYDNAVATRNLAGSGRWFYMPAIALGVILILSESTIRIWSVMDAGFRLVNVLLVFGLALGGGVAVRILSTPAAVLAGKATYAIYILHIPLLWWYKRLPLYQAIPGPAAALIFVIGVVLVSIAVYILLEEPANRLLRRRGGARVPEPSQSREIPLRTRRAASEAA